MLGPYRPAFWKHLLKLVYIAKWFKSKIRVQWCVYTCTSSWMFWCELHPIRLPLDQTKHSRSGNHHAIFSRFFLWAEEQNSRTAESNWRQYPFFPNRRPSSSHRASLLRFAANEQLLHAKHAHRETKQRLWSAFCQEPCSSKLHSSQNLAEFLTNGIMGYLKDEKNHTGLWVQSHDPLSKDEASNSVSTRGATSKRTRKQCQLWSIPTLRV